MTLREYLRDTEDDFFYVGVQNGYLTIGNKKTVTKDLEILSKEYLQKYKCSIENNKKMHDRYEKLIPVHQEELKKLENNLAKYKEREKLELVDWQREILQDNIKTTQTRIENKKVTIDYQTKELPRIENYIQKIEKYLSGYKKFMSRRVVDVSETRFQNPKGVIVLLEGEEYGMYWDYEEYLRKEGNEYGK